MRVLMVRVVDMPVLVIQRFVLVFVTMGFGEMKVEPERHQRSGDHKAHRHGFVEHEEREHCANEWRGREICACARGSQISQRQHEQHKAHAVTKEAGDARARYRPAPGRCAPVASAKPKFAAPATRPFIIAI
jgi:hypothetical protein